MKPWREPGFLAAVPVILFLLVGFAGPLLMVFGYSFMPPRTFSLAQVPTLANFVSVITDSFYISFLWSVGLATVTVALLLLICYPVAYGMAKMFGKWANLVTVLIAIPLLVSENIRLFGWVLVLLKGGILYGSVKMLFGIELPSLLYTVPSIVFGLFGLGLFVIFLGFGARILSGSLTLACLILPTIIVSSEEALRAVPRSLREGSLALGAKIGRAHV